MLHARDAAELQVILNMDDRELEFELPRLDGRGWRRAFDSAPAAPNGAFDQGTEPSVDDGRLHRADERSTVVLVSAPT
jgi:hypothetical protein